MKFYSKYTVPVLMALVFSLTHFNCKITDPVEGLEVRLNNLARKTFISVAIINSADGMPVNEKINVTFSGADAAKIITDTGEPLSKMETSDGQLLFAISDGVTPSADKPVKFNVLITSANHLSTSIPVTITREGITQAMASLVKYTQLPAGVVSKAADLGTVTSAGTPVPMSMNSGEEVNSESSAQIDIPQGTKFYGTDGKQLTGKVEGRITYFNPVDETSLRSFPGGLAVSAKTETGAMQQVNFVTAGFTAIDITVNGQEVETFSSPVSVGMSIPDNLVNPETGAPVKNGDVIPLWSYDEDKGEWEFEQNITVTMQSQPGNIASAGKLMAVSNNIKHLSYYNLDWYYNSCYYASKINLTGGKFIEYGIKLKRLDNNSYINYWPAQVKGTEPWLQFLNAPSGIPIRIEVYKLVNTYYEGDLVAQKDVTDLCGGAEINIDVPEDPRAANLKMVTVNVAAICTNSEPVRRLNISGYPIYMKGPGEYWYNYIGYLTDGKLQKELMLGEEYEFMAYFNGRWYYSNQYPEIPKVITQTEYKFEIKDPEQFCN